MGLQEIKINAFHESINIKGSLSSDWDNKRYKFDSVQKRRNVILLSTKEPTEKDIEWGKAEIKKLNFMQNTNDVIVGGR